ncbi:hypothetical protein LXJ58_35965, partial [Escherichia coli]|nr:hypothetical protein [Escherichia coli]
PAAFSIAGTAFADRTSRTHASIAARVAGDGSRVDDTSGVTSPPGSCILSPRLSSIDTNPTPALISVSHQTAIGSIMKDPAPRELAIRFVLDRHDRHHDVATLHLRDINAQPDGRHAFRCAACREPVTTRAGSIRQPF